MNLKQALWSGRFEGGMDDSTLAFTCSLDTDSRMAFYDVMGSLAHVRMLKACGVIPADDADKIAAGLKVILKDVEAGTFEFDRSREDVHTCIEFALTEAIGPAGGKLHTARSRNDQVATDFRMYLRDAALQAAEAVNGLMMSLVRIAETNGDTVMPGFTHMQHAQPVTLAQHMLAHAFRFSRDADRFLDAFRRMDKCPLGAAALAGTTFPIDRGMTSEALGFREPTENSMDSVSDRDFATELSYCCAQTAVHLSSLCEELVLWSSQEFAFIEMDDRYTTGSSIMPQKKNPDIAELVRGKTGQVIGSLTAMLVMTKGLPLTYNRDLQEDKAPVMDAMDIVISSAGMMSKVVSTTTFHNERMYEVTSAGQINATDLADYLVTKGIPFREAHGIVGAAVRKSIDTGVNLEDMTLEQLREFSPLISEDVFDILPVKRCVERRCSYGGTAPSSTDAQISKAVEQMMLRDEVVRQEKQLISNCWKALLD
ncbi:MAG: argininosuccinate lyase [Thermoplasmata archaeon]|nr:argininosuccinate lyase [Thermoplasmata archaeon]